MGFTIGLVILYLILFASDIYAFIQGKEDKKWAPCIIITALIIAGIVILGYLWLASSM